MDVIERIKKDIAEHAVVVYMKGEMDEPQCGFSAAVMQVFSELGTDIQTRNVLTDPELREGLKQYSQWPTIPQVYIGGKFIGGCDITLELHRRGQLEGLIDEALSHHS